MYLISQNGRLIANMDNIADVYIHAVGYMYDGENHITHWDIMATYPAVFEDSLCALLAEYNEHEEEKCVKQFEAFKKALLAEEKFFDVGKEIE